MLFARILATAVVAALLTATPSAAFTTALPSAPAAPSPSGGGDCASLSVGPGVLSQGKSATISYSNPGMAGQTVVVDVDNGMQRDPQTATIEIQLDAKGNGSATWTVPCWSLAKFNAPGAAEVSCAVARD